MRVGCAGANYLFSTQKERDVETGLDYFGARYFSNSQGRSPDPVNPMLSASNDTQGEALFLRYIAEPANWNKYTYVYCIAR